jgi:YD repeat-containing protein
LYADATFAATNMPLASSYSAVAQDTLGRKDTNTVTLNLSTNVSFKYDASGNLTNDSLRVFQYDDENQLTSVWATNAWKSDFTYDGLRRRRAETNYTWTGGDWVKSSERRFIYDGNLVIEERDGNNRSQVYYTRGRDLSGTIAGAGGIGGLLARTPTTDYVTSSQAAHAFYFSDGNGNVTTLIGTNQLVLAKYVYDSSATPSPAPARSPTSTCVVSPAKNSTSTAP